MRVSLVIPIIASVVCASGAIVPRLDFQELMETSPRILHARVLDSRVASSGEFLWTHYRLQVLDRLKGDFPSEITVSEPGGALNGLTMHVAGVVEYRAGEEVILFLSPTPIGYWRTTGFSQGKFSVVQAGGRKRVRANLKDAAFVDLRTRAASARMLDALNGLDLDEFKAEIRRQAGR